MAFLKIAIIAKCKTSTDRALLQNSVARLGKYRMTEATDVTQARILIVDDQEAGAQSLKDLLEASGYRNVEYTIDPCQVSELHALNHYNLILLDLHMPRMDGFQVMHSLNAVESEGYMPVITISGDDACKLPALKAGAKDFLRKPFEAEEALTRIRNLLEIRLLHEGARNAASTLEILAQQDPLTDLGNRRFLTTRIAAALANARRNDSAMGVIYLDLDGFKQVNDNFGHDVGDALLKIVAKRLVSVVRAEDTVARVGGDEFMIALWQVSHVGQVATVGSKLINILAQPYNIDGKRLSITTSVGASIYPTHGTDADTLMRNADQALYEAKHAGKNTYRIAMLAVENEDDRATAPLHCSN